MEDGFREHYQHHLRIILIFRENFQILGISSIVLNLDFGMKEKKMDGKFSTNFEINNYDVISEHK